MAKPGNSYTCRLCVELVPYADACTHMEERHWKLLNAFRSSAKPPESPSEGTRARVDEILEGCQWVILESREAG